MRKVFFVKKYIWCSYDFFEKWWYLVIHWIVLNWSENIWRKHSLGNKKDWSSKSQQVFFFFLLAPSPFSLSTTFFIIPLTTLHVTNVACFNHHHSRKLVVSVTKICEDTFLFLFPLWPYPFHLFSLLQLNNNKIFF